MLKCQAWVAQPSLPLHPVRLERKHSLATWVICSLQGLGVGLGLCRGSGGGLSHLGAFSTLTCSAGKACEEGLEVPSSLVPTPFQSSPEFGGRRPRKDSVPAALPAHVPAPACSLGCPSPAIFKATGERDMTVSRRRVGVLF